VCDNCNTRQAVPADAKVVVGEPSKVLETAQAAMEKAQDVARRAPWGAALRRTGALYAFVWIGGWTLMGLGMIAMLFGIFGESPAAGMGFEGVLGRAGMIANGLVLMGIGQLFHCIRDIGRRMGARDRG
jgi:hypothetical protein